MSSDYDYLGGYANSWTRFLKGKKGLSITKKRCDYYDELKKKPPKDLFCLDKKIEVLDKYQRDVNKQRAKLDRADKKLQAYLKKYSKKPTKQIDNQIDALTQEILDIIESNKSRGKFAFSDNPTVEKFIAELKRDYDMDFIKKLIDSYSGKKITDLNVHKYAKYIVYHYGIDFIKQVIEALKNEGHPKNKINFDDYSIEKLQKLIDEDKKIQIARDKQIQNLYKILDKKDSVAKNKNLNDIAINIVDLTTKKKDVIDDILDISKIIEEKYGIAASDRLSNKIKKGKGMCCDNC